MSNLQDLVDNAMQSCIEGYAASVVDSIEFELKRELSTEEHQQVYAAVDLAITGIDAAQKEINNLKMKLSDAGCLLVEWKQRVEKAENERDLLAVQLEIATERSGINFDRAQKAEAALSAANEKLSKPVVLPPRRSASSFVDEEFSNKDLAAIYNAARIEFSVKITNAGFTVEGE